MLSRRRQDCLLAVVRHGTPSHKLLRTSFLLCDVGSRACRVIFRDLVISCVSSCMFRLTCLFIVVANPRGEISDNFVSTNGGVRHDSSQSHLEELALFANGARLQNVRGRVAGPAGISTQQAVSIANSYRAAVGGSGYATSNGFANYGGDHSAAALPHRASPGFGGQNVNAFTHRPAQDNFGSGGQGLSPQPIFDIEPTPISELGRPHNGQSSHNGYGQSHQSHPHQQQPNQQFHWFQR